jgi:purine catabolism regulator
LGGAVDPVELARSHVEAGYAVERATEPGLHAWTEVRERGVLSLLDADRLAAFARELLAPLCEAGVAPTLEVFLRHHGSVVATAEELGVHRNTVRNRLATAERLLGRSLDDAATRMDVWAALQAPPAR